MFDISQRKIKKNNKSVYSYRQVQSIFISRLVSGGLAESTGLLAVNDEVLEVNGISVQGKLLDQVTDMMVANSSNLILTVKPANQRNNVSPKKALKSKSNLSTTTTSDTSSHSYNPSVDSSEVVDDEDEVKVHLLPPPSKNEFRSSGKENNIRSSTSSYDKK